MAAAPPPDEFDGFAILEEAAVTLLDRPDACELGGAFTGILEDFLTKRTGDPVLAKDLSTKFGEIIELRRKEIELASGSNPSEATQ